MNGIDIAKKVRFSLGQNFVFGTMRLHEIGFDAAKTLLTDLLLAGVCRFHSSFEYQSYPLFCEALESACKEAQIDSGKLLHTVKLASPHFGEEKVSQKDIETHIHRYLADLKVECLYQIQWMARIDLKREDLRLSVLANQSYLLQSLFSQLKCLGKIDQAICFPYTIGFAEKAIASGAFNGIVDYFNPLEINALAYLPQLRAANMSFSALRPFAAGQCFEKGYAIADLFKFIEKNQPIEGIIAGTGSFDHFSLISQQFENVDA